jgi:carboxypeptidase Taq
MLRFGIERRPDRRRDRGRRTSPALWDDGMASLLGLDTRGNFKDGCMQDVHWSTGLVGYFPCYTLGADVRGAVVRGDPPRRRRTSTRASPTASLAPVFDWLREHIWLAGEPLARPPSSATRASGEALEPGPLPPPPRTRYLGQGDGLSRNVQ